jgi:hypothetical protein
VQGRDRLSGLIPAFCSGYSTHIPCVAKHRQQLDDPATDLFGVLVDEGEAVVRGIVPLHLDIPASQDATFEVLFFIPDQSAIGSYQVEAQPEPTQGN